MDPQATRIKTHIRPAATKELDRLPVFLQLLFSIEPDFTFDPQRQLQGLKLLHSDPDCEVLVAVNGEGNIVGMVTGQLTISTSEGGPSLLVEDLVVAPEWRRQKIATRLLDAIGCWAMSRGARRMQLLADISNHPALAFYENVGWRRSRMICLRRFLSPETLP